MILSLLALCEMVPKTDELEHDYVIRLTAKRKLDLQFAKNQELYHQEPSNAGFFVHYFSIKTLIGVISHIVFKPHLHNFRTSILSNLYF